MPVQNFWILFKLHLNAGVPVIECLCLPIHMNVCLATVFVLTLVCIYLCVSVRASIQFGTVKELSLLSK